MRSELQGLEITKGEFKHLSGLGMNQVYRPATWQKFAKEGFKTLIISILILISYGILAAVFEQHHPLLILTHVIIGVGVLLDDLYKIFISVRNPDLLHIFDQIDRYNAIVQSLILHEDLEKAGNLDVKIYQREQVLAALNFLRADLVRALKTEKIIRRNKQFIANNQDLIETDLSTIITAFNFDETTEPGRLLNESLQLATEVHQKLKQLQQKHSTR
ncbi:hypothetical protein [Lyngbya sp. PCC 8106]|uniref:hypothetical protein n=1 Tax=Lyngbya sp. (strain PCC 8106) TaxID=313612 RepID=UPI0000EAB6ED|nr:hypothetical protein [Lyngbya sp. PCC 8106]EAW36559.1 hypothetical protein L8106_28316 [Lyngbya sp. PCC 8106]